MDDDSWTSSWGDDDLGDLSEWWSDDEEGDASSVCAVTGPAVSNSDSKGLVESILGIFIQLLYPNDSLTMQA